MLQLKVAHAFTTLNFVCLSALEFHNIIASQILTKLASFINFGQKVATVFSYIPHAASYLKYIVAAPSVMHNN